MRASRSLRGAAASVGAIQASAPPIPVTLAVSEVKDVPVYLTALGTVQAYNTAVQSMPTALFAGLLGFSPRPYFTAREGSDVAPEVKFDFGGGSPAPAPPATPATNR